ncbi:hypothetical protein B296_00002107 [Ensete ventricosum]|uniref:Uncharacterized protein n=1 Tax=Ensete ventricosum TaxID=4639 RepID=A0A427ABP2_ENSVE|nr:hypothetical protein B296_00002107 [Ensete ventricosum]
MAEGPTFGGGVRFYAREGGSAPIDLSLSVSLASTASFFLIWGPKRRKWEQQRADETQPCFARCRLLLFLLQPAKKTPLSVRAAILASPLLLPIAAVLQDMAEEFGVGSLQLPSELLDDVFVDGRGERRAAAEAVEPVTESESDEEGDYLAGLARQMAHSFLLDDDSGILGLSGGDDAKVSESVKPSMFARLVRVKAPLILRRTSPLKHRLTATSSPPCSPLEPPKGDAWDPLHEAGEQAMWSKLTDAEHGRWRVYEHKLLSQSRKPCTSKSTSHQLQAARVRLLRTQNSSYYKSVPLKLRSVRLTSLVPINGSFTRSSSSRPRDGKGKSKQEEEGTDALAPWARLLPDALRSRCSIDPSTDLG